MQEPTARNAAPLSRRASLAALGALGAAAWAQTARADQPAQSPRPEGAVPLEGSRLRSHLTDAQFGWDPAARKYALPELPYAYDALEPHLDAQTMELHHGKHHRAYVDGLNKALDELARIREGKGDPSLMKHWSRELAFHGGGHVNHTLFWLTMVPPLHDAPKRPSLDLLDRMERSFGGFEQWKNHMRWAAASVEGGGWAWLVYDPVSGNLLVTQMESQQNHHIPGTVPLLGVDVWEHAYYLKFQNRRTEYIEAWLNVVNWPMVDELFSVARGL